MYFMLIELLPLQILLEVEKQRLSLWTGPLEHFSSRPQAPLAHPLPVVLPQGRGDVHSHPGTTSAPSPGHWVSKVPAQLEISKHGFCFNIHFLKLLGRRSSYAISRQKGKIYAAFCKKVYERAPAGCSARPWHAWWEVLQGPLPAWWTCLMFSTRRHGKEPVQPVNHFIYFLL